MQLGSVFEGADEATPRGDDLRHRVVVNPADFGAAGGVDLRVPPRLTNDLGIVVDRAASASDTPGRVLVQLPPASTAPFQLRLRGMGGPPPAGGVPGDLFLHVEAGDVPRLSEDRIAAAGAATVPATRAAAAGVVAAAVVVAAAWATCA
jgi:hypothetical protein